MLVYTSYRPRRSTHHPCIPHTIYLAPGPIPKPRDNSEFMIPIKHHQHLQPQTNTKPRGKGRRKKASPTRAKPSIRPRISYHAKHEIATSIACSHMTTSQTESPAPGKQTGSESTECRPLVHRPKHSIHRAPLRGNARACSILWI